MRFSHLIAALVVVFSVCTTAIHGYALREPLALTKFGHIRGSIGLSRGGRPFMSFRGIPYAKPPVGALRFKAPQKADAWPFPLDARHEGPFCIQKNYFFEAQPRVTGQEDCLYLNVYAPVRAAPSGRLPVMVFIHYGGYLAGRGTSDYLGPEYFMDKDVVLVTFNYRLGAFGFLTTLDDAAPGNYAFKDQVAALRWVKENIRSFMGDPQRITIFGQSAGAGSVGLHMVSPLSQGLFHRVISESGSPFNLWLKPLNDLQRNITAAQATFVGCHRHLGNSSALVSCLRDVDAAVLADSADKFKYFNTEPLIPYTIVTEKKTALNPEPFITKDPIQYFSEGEFQHVPWISGVVKDEGILRASPFLRQPQTRAALNQNFDALMPQMLLLQVSTTDPSALWTALKDFYLGGGNSVDVTDPKSVQGFIDLYSDRAFLYGMYQHLKVYSALSSAPVWVYNFAYRGEHSYGDLFALTKENIDFDWGVSHCDDLLYLFRTNAYFPKLTKQLDNCISHTMIDLWTNFAIFGNPDPLDEVNWAPTIVADGEKFAYLNISGSAKDNVLKLNIDNDFYTERINFWRNLTINENLNGHF